MSFIISSSKAMATPDKKGISRKRERVHLRLWRPLIKRERERSSKTVAEEFVVCVLISLSFSACSQQVFERLDECFRSIILNFK